MAQPRQTAPLYLASLALDPAGALPLHRQLYLGLRGAILESRIAPGARLPSTRTLAQDLGVSRNTVLAAFEQLLAEGYLEGRVGAGSFVSQQLPEDALNARAVPKSANEREGRADGSSAAAPGASERGRLIAAAAPDNYPARPFSPSLPELAGFPFEDWAKRLHRAWREPKTNLLAGVDVLGHRALREALATYLGAARAVRCTPDQIVVTSGAQQALHLAAQALLDPGDQVWVEDPGYPGLNGILAGAGAELVPLPVDEEGLVVEAGRRTAPRARMACVSPSHQFPLGVTLSLARRLELLEWAKAANAFVLEDDYDSEFRYGGRPLAALQGLDDGSRVIYVGTLSKVMFAGLRVGYLVAPPQLVSTFAAARRLTDAHPATTAQPALAGFIADGSLAAHTRRMRSLYAKRQKLFLEAAADILGDRVALEPREAGLHLTGMLAPGLDDKAVSREARALGVEAPPLSVHYLSQPARHGLLLGYAGVAEAQLEGSLRRLARAIERAGAKPAPAGGGETVEAPAA